MLIELGVMQQRHEAVLEVLGGTCVSEVARRCGVTRQTVHRYLSEESLQAVLAKAADAETVAEVSALPAA